MVWLLDVLGEDEAEASVPMHMSEVSEDTADDDLSSRYLTEPLVLLEFQGLVCFLLALSRKTYIHIASSSGYITLWHAVWNSNYIV